MILCIYLAHWKVYEKRLDRATASLPVPPCLPVLGNAMIFLGDCEKVVKNLEDIAEISYKNKGAVKLWLGPKLYVVISNAEDAKTVLENCLDKDRVYRFLRPWLGRGLFIAPCGKLRVVLDMLFDREIQFTNDQLREHLDSITIAGNDTTALVIAYTLVLLGMHQNVQNKVFKE
ncbi:unnamed protein product [Parnassius apollo]|uniref:(apollo) hypothetical protein n=1 Tax=Parnassius apollo TaxID=110799 RepID=A0A8S3W658_PARAO|nr:unnamed protein product [Parnassius apollo]